MATRRKKQKDQPKQIVYLLGAGATQAEVSYLGARPVNLLMRDSDQFGEGVSTGILAKMGQHGLRFSGERGVDIEKLISLLTASGADAHSKLAERMRKRYFEEICTRLLQSRIMGRPQLAVALLEMHSNRSFQDEVENLTGIVTTNHDGLLQIAYQEVFGALNVGFPFVSRDFISATTDTVPPLLQLHGSFSWKFAVPIGIEKLQRGSKYSPETMWIPPSVLKESKNYPFNKLVAFAYEILAKQCDVLRIVGASLTQNDWNVLCLIFNAQRHRELVKGSAFRIELIMPTKPGDEIQADCPYLKNTTPIGYLTEGEFGLFKEPNFPADSEMNNPFAYWLKEKINYHRRRHELGAGALPASMGKLTGEIS